jgi:capsular polysaccharide transport system permease protein
MEKDGSSDIDLAERRDQAEFVSASPFWPVTSSGLLARLTGTRSAKPPLVIDAPADEGVSGPVPWRPSAYLISFIVCVAAPALAVSLYFAFIASYQYVAETSFAVRSASNDAGADKLKTMTSSIGAIPSVAGQDAYIIANYIRSRAIVDDLSKSIDLREVFRRPEADFWARLEDKASVEELTKYWREMVSASVEATSGIVTVRVTAFRSDDALTLANAIIKSSEALGNEISVRARADAMTTAEREVRGAQGRVLSALADLRSFRDQVGFIDPLTQATSGSALLTALLAQRIKLQGDYFVASSAMSPEAPRVQGVKTRLDALDRQIDEQKAKLTGNSAGSATIASLLPKYEELELQSTFAQKLYTLAQAGLERARQRVKAQSVYISVFAPPALPEEAEYPKPFVASAFIAMALLVLWGIGAFTAATVEDHRI